MVYADGIDARNKRRTDIPIILGYSGDHFVSLIPSSEDDEKKTVKLVEAFKTSEYEIPEPLKDLFNFNKTLTQKGKKAEKKSSEEKAAADEFENES